MPNASPSQRWKKGQKVKLRKTGTRGIIIIPPDSSGAVWVQLEEWFICGGKAKTTPKIIKTHPVVLIYGWQR